MDEFDRKAAGSRRVREEERAKLPIAVHQVVQRVAVENGGPQPSAKRDPGGHRADENHAAASASWASASLSIRSV